MQHSALLVAASTIIALAGCTKPQNDSKQSQPPASKPAADPWGSAPPAVSDSALRVGMAALPRVLDWPRLEAWQQGARLRVDPEAEAKALAHFKSTREMMLMGEQVMRTYCVGCHGLTGKGDGPMASGLQNNPRNLVKGPYRFKSTKPGQAPTAQDIYRTISEGLWGTPMTPFADLPPHQRWAVVYYIMSLGKVFDKDCLPTPQGIPAQECPKSFVPPHTQASPIDPQSLSLGKTFYSQMGCATCHGAQGDGKGPASAGLKDIPPANFAGDGIKRGDGIDDVFMSLKTGLDGTAMMSYEGRLKDSDLWLLAAYVWELGASVRNKAKPVTEPGSGQHGHGPKGH